IAPPVVSRYYVLSTLIMPPNRVRTPPFVWQHACRSESPSGTCGVAPGRRDAQSRGSGADTRGGPAAPAPDAAGAGRAGGGVPLDHPGDRGRPRRAGALRHDGEAGRRARRRAGGDRRLRPVLPAAPPAARGTRRPVSAAHPLRLAKATL